MVTRVAGDGDCLFHALGFSDKYDGNALRIEVADFMEAHAHNEPALDQDIWLQEAGALRANRWGGHAAVVAYSLLKQRRVLIHARQPGGPMLVQDAAHEAVPVTAPLQHILYNGQDHYDALEEVVDAAGLVPAWEQPPPPKYLAQPGAAPFAAGSFPALSSSAAQPRRKRPSAKFAAPRPAKKTKTAKVKTAGASKTPPVLRQEAAASSAEPAAPAPAPFAEDREMSEEEEERGAHQLLRELAAIPVAPTSAHPHRRAEDLIEDGLPRSARIGRAVRVTARKAKL